MPLMNSRPSIGLLAMLLATLLGVRDARAEAMPSPGGRLHGTGGVTQVEGAAGGGLTPWALIAGYGTRDQIGATAFHTSANPSDFTLRSQGIALGFYDRFEVSYAQQRLGLGTTVPGQQIELSVIGLKVKLLGDAVYDQDRVTPQIALGVQYKKNHDMVVPTLLGARSDHGTDLYLAATKLWLAGVLGRNVLANATIRGTRANQLGLLGFGGDTKSGYRVLPELSVGVFLHDRLAAGLEYRYKPDNLSIYQEDDFWDIWSAWFISKRFSVTAAYVRMGQIADKHDQRALYLSGQLSF